MRAIDADVLRIAICETTFTDLPTEQMIELIESQPTCINIVEINRLKEIWEEAMRTSSTSTVAFCTFAEIVLNLTKEAQHGTD